MRTAYVRVSTVEQNEARQVEALKKYDIEKWFIEKHQGATEEKPSVPKECEIEDYFDGSFGINHSDDQKPEVIRIKVFGQQVEYIRHLPIHESQNEVEETEEWSIFEYRLVPCFNFYQQLLWHRERLEVLEPLHVRDEMKKTIEKMLEHYSTQQKP